MRKELQSKTVKELRVIAKEKGVKGIWTYTRKSDLIEAIIAMDVDNVVEVKVEQAIKETIIENDSINPDVSGNDTPPSEPCKPTEAYIETLKPGTLVAFKINTKDKKSLVLSAKFIRFVDGKTPENGLYLITKNGDKCKIKAERILWVKTGARWPKWIYVLFNHDKKVVKEE